MNQVHLVVVVDGRRVVTHHGSIAAAIFAARYRIYMLMLLDCVDETLRQYHLD